MKRTIIYAALVIAGLSSCARIDPRPSHWLGGTKKDTTPPQTIIVSPAQGDTLRGVAELIESSIDNIFTTRVDFVLNNTTIIGTTSAPFSGKIQWNSTSVPNGTYILTSVAYDAASNKDTSKPVTMVVDNPNTDTTFICPTNFGITLVPDTTDNNGNPVVNNQLFQVTTRGNGPGFAKIHISAITGGSEVLYDSIQVVEISETGEHITNMYLSRSLTKSETATIKVWAQESRCGTTPAGIPMTYH